MPDAEKVIKGLEICSSGEWNSTGGRDHTSCPYYPAGYTGCTCKLLLRDALALLKAQEPMVMTLEEALGSEECWLERKDGNVTVADIALNGQDSGGYDVDSNELSTMRRYIFHSGYYGKYWRCWTSRPDEKRRAETPWQQ